MLSVIDTRLKLAGVERKRVLRATVWLKDITKDFAAMNKAWNEWVGAPVNKPVRATVEAKLATPAMLVEIQVEAARYRGLGGATGDERKIPCIYCSLARGVW